jgi:hypothetical protein
VSRYADLRDRHLEAVAAGLLTHDDRLRGLQVEVRFDGGVAHVEGHVPTQGHRDDLREALVGLRGVFAVWDGVRVGDQGPLRVLDIGSAATRQKPYAAALDLVPHAGVDVVADLRDRLPLADGSVDRVYAVHVLEHVIDLVPVMNELHRVVAPDGVLHAMSPDHRSIGAIADPTHVKLFATQTFKYFCRHPNPGVLPWLPLCVSYDGASVLADLTPVRDPARVATEERLARFFD